MFWVGARPCACPTRDDRKGTPLPISKCFSEYLYFCLIVGFSLAGFSTTLGLLLIASFIRTFGSGISWVYSSTLLQVSVPNKFLGPILAFDLAMMTMASSISTLWVGWTKDGLGMSPQQTALILAGVPVVMVVGWSFFLASRLRQPHSLQQSVNLP